MVERQARRRLALWLRLLAARSHALHQTRRGEPVSHSPRQSPRLLPLVSRSRPVPPCMAAEDEARPCRSMGHRLDDPEGLRNRSHREPSRYHRQRSPILRHRGSSHLDLSARCQRSHGSAKRGIHAFCKARHPASIAPGRIADRVPLSPASLESLSASREPVRRRDGDIPEWPARRSLRDPLRHPHHRLPSRRPLRERSARPPPGRRHASRPRSFGCSLQPQCGHASDK